MPPGGPMAELTPLDEKLGEVLGLAQAAQDATSKVAGMEGADELQDQLEQMGKEAAETERRTDELVGGLEGRKSPIRDKAAGDARKTPIRDKDADTKRKAKPMMHTYLGGEEGTLDGFEFLTMAEAGE